MVNNQMKLKIYLISKMRPIKPCGSVFLKQDEGLKREYSARRVSNNRGLKKYFDSGLNKIKPCFLRQL